MRFLGWKDARHLGVVNDDVWIMAVKSLQSALSFSFSLTELDPHFPTILLQRDPGSTTWPLDI